MHLHLKREFIFSDVLLYSEHSNKHICNFYSTHFLNILITSDLMYLRGIIDYF